jgi:adenylylsulfate kinase
VPPERFDIRVEAEGAPRYWAERILQKIRPVFDPKRPTALFLGRYQPFHDGHRALILEGIRRVGQACIAVRDTQGNGAKDPFPFFEVKARIEAGLSDMAGRYLVVPLPNITHIFYGRDVGYSIERLHLGEAARSHLRHRPARGLVRLLQAPLAPCVTCAVALVTSHPR